MSVRLIKQISILLVFVLVLALAPTSLYGQVKTIKIAMVGGAGSPEDAIANAFKRAIEMLHPTEVKVDVYTGEILGAVMEMVDGLRAGTIEMAIDDTPAFSRVFKPMLIFSMPYVFDNVEQFSKAVRSPVWKEMMDKMAKQTGLRCIGIAPRAPRTITTTNLIIRSPADMKGMKIRSPEVKETIEIYKALGARPTVISYGEVYLALKMGVAEGQENPPVNIVNMKFYEVQKYLIQTGPMFSSSALVINEKFFQSLSPELRTDIIAAGEIAAKYGEDLDRIADEASKRFLRTIGKMTFIEVDEKPFKMATKDVYKLFLGGDFSEEFYRAMRRTVGAE